MNDQRLAPVVIFAYDRVDHLKATINALRDNFLAPITDVYVYSDGPKPGVEGSVSKVREYLSCVAGFKSITVKYSENNQGLAKSIISGVTEIINEYGRVIVLEDDIVTSPYFLNFMSDALDFYEKDLNIWSVSGYTLPKKYFLVDKYINEDVFLHPRPMPWGWATWSNRWDKNNWDGDFTSFIKYKDVRKKFNKLGDDMSMMLNAQLDGQINSWYVRWAYSAMTARMKTIYPVISLTANLGHDSSGTHCADDIYGRYTHQIKDLADCAPEIEPDLILNEQLVKHFNDAFVYDPSFMGRLRRIKRNIFI